MNKKPNTGDPAGPSTLASSEPVEVDWSSIVAVWKNQVEHKLARVPDNPVLTKFNVECNELAQTWLKFHQALPLENRVDFEDRAQTAEDVVTLIRRMQAGWTSNRPYQQLFRRCVTLADSFVVSIDTHAILLAVLASNELYISLIYGALQSIFKASENYPSVAEGFLKIHVDINEAVARVCRQDNCASINDSASDIAEMYTMVFWALASCMDWYTKISACRMLKSLNHNAHFDLLSLIDSIKESARGFVRKFADEMDLDEPEIGGSGEPSQQLALFQLKQSHWRQVGLRGLARRDAAKLTWLHRSIWDTKRDAAIRLEMEQNKESLVHRLLPSASHSNFRVVREPNSQTAFLKVESAAPPLGELGLLKNGLEKPKGTRSKLTKIGLQLGSAHFQDFFDNDSQVADLSPDVEVGIDAKIKTSLKEWAEDPRSQVLAIGQRQPPRIANPVSFISFRYAHLTRQAGLPVASHFCTLPSESRMETSSLEEGVIALAYSLLRQFIELLPPFLDCDINSAVKPNGLGALKGKLTSWEDVLHAIDVMLHFMPPVMILLIDSLHVLYHSSTESQIRSLLQIFFRHARYPNVIPMLDGNKPSVLTKTLITIAGEPNWLLEIMAEYSHPPNQTRRAAQRSKLNQVLGSDVWAVTMGI